MFLVRSCTRTALSFIRALRPKRPACGSVVRALSRSMSRQDFDSVLLNCTDPRDVLTLVAKVLEIPLPQVLEEVAKVLGLPFSSVLPSLDREKVTQQFPGISLTEYYRCGCMPVVVDGQIEVVACVDPALVEDQLPALSGYPKVLVTWPTVRRALGVLPASIEVDGSLESPRKERDRAEKGLLALMREAEKHDAIELTLHLPEVLSRTAEYRFVTRGNKLARGVIHGELSRTLREWCANGANLNRSLGGTDWELRLSSGGTFVFSRAASPKVEPERIEVRAGDVGAAQVTSTPHRYSDQVMIVEDQGIFAQVLSRYLSRQGITCTRCASGTEALEALRHSSCLPAAILSDVHMPGMGGRDLVGALKAHSEWSSIPVLMLTSDTSAELEVQLISEGAHACLRKHEDPRVIAAYVARFMRRAERIEGKDAA
ncbi:MAG: response regulator [Bdellovibrionota bacterium]|nr:MAG: response regulator [Bdellovibrionota bacterium]